MKTRTKKIIDILGKERILESVYYEDKEFDELWSKG